MQTEFIQEADELWTVERPLRLAGLTLSTRMTVVRLAGGGLWLHSPVALDDAVLNALDGLGNVRHIVAPNRFHHLYLEGYRHAYPKARFHAAPGLAEKRRDFAFDEVLADRPPAAWAGQIDQHLVAGCPALNEVVFYHHPSRTLILTDLAFHVGPSAPFGLRLWARLNLAYGRLEPTLLVKMLFRDPQSARASLDAILAWDFQRIVVNHGQPVFSRPREALATAYAWLK